MANKHAVLKRWPSQNYYCFRRKWTGFCRFIWAMFTVAGNYWLWLHACILKWCGQVCISNANYDRQPPELSRPD